MFDRGSGDAADIEDRGSLEVPAPEVPEAAVAAPFVAPPSTTAEMPASDPPEPTAVHSTDEPTASPSPEPAATSPIRKPKPATTPAPAVDGPACVEARDMAARARLSRRWSEVLQATAIRSCWKTPSERSFLRTLAYYNLGDHDACMREGRGSKQERIAELVAICESKVKGK